MQTSVLLRRVRGSLSRFVAWLLTGTVLTRLPSGTGWLISGTTVARTPRPLAEPITVKAVPLATYNAAVAAGTPLNVVAGTDVDPLLPDGTFRIIANGQISPAIVMGGGSPTISFVGGVTDAWTAAGTRTVSLTTLTGGLSSAPVTGDYVEVAAGMAGNVNPAFTTPSSGWTMTPATVLFANDANDAGLVIFSKVMGATPDATISIDSTGSTSTPRFADVTVWRGVDQTTPLDVTPTTATGIDTTIPNPPAITPVTAGAVIVVTAIAAHNDTVNWPLTAPALDFMTPVTRAAGASWRGSILTGAKLWPGSGAYDPDALTIGRNDVADSWASITRALRPA